MSYDDCVRETSNIYSNLNFEPYYRNYLIKIDRYQNYLDGNDICIKIKFR